jgi:poly(3-hydroxyalkanoate) synthetase
MRLLRMLEANALLASAIVQRRSEADERRLNWLIGICLGGMLVCLAVAAYAMKYVK